MAARGGKKKGAAKGNKSNKNDSDNVEKLELQDHIHWYPGHIAKAERKLKEQVSLVDVVIEVLDARIPFSSQYTNIESLLGEKPRLILLNKADLTNEVELKQCVEKIKEDTTCPVLVSDAKNSKSLAKIVSKVVELAEPKIQALMDRGLLRRSARVMVVGMPNVGKSSIINKLTRTSKTKIGAKAGVTRQQQWVRVNPKLDLLDTPGIIPMKQADQIKAQKLAFVNSVSEKAYSHEAVSQELLKILSEKYPDRTKEHYKLKEDEELTIENIAQSRNWVIKGGELDLERTSKVVLNDFRAGKIGKFILDTIEDDTLIRPADTFSRQGRREVPEELKKNILKYAKDLRKNSTEPEQILWHFLRGRQFNDLKFRRQARIDNYIVDFVCFEKKLVIELDGSGHLSPEQIENDKKRDKYLKENNFKVIRFFNDKISNNIEEALEEIYQEIMLPSPLTGEGA